MGGIAVSRFLYVSNFAEVGKNQLHKTMKRFLFISCFLIAGQLAICAQELIITVDAEKIEAHILQISEAEVQYKKASYPEGPTFIIATDKIASITFANGEVQTFHQQNAVEEKKTQQYESYELMTKSGSYYSYGNVTMNKAQYAAFLKQNCPAAYQEFQSGDKLVHAGIGLLVGGLASEMIGLGIYSAAVNMALSGNSSAVGIATASSAFFWIGGCLEIACIPTWIVGGVRRKNSVNTFNISCAKRTEVPVSIGMTIGSNGVGLALKF